MVSNDTKCLRKNNEGSRTIMGSHADADHLTTANESNMTLIATIGM